MSVQKINFTASLLNDLKINHSNQQQQSVVAEQNTDSPAIQAEDNTAENIDEPQTGERENHTVRNVAIGTVGGILVLTSLGVMGRKWYLGKAIQKRLGGLKEPKPTEHGNVNSGSSGVADSGSSISHEEVVTPTELNTKPVTSPKESNIPLKNETIVEQDIEQYIATEAEKETIHLPLGGKMTRAEKDSIDTDFMSMLPIIDKELLKVTVPTYKEVEKIFKLSKFKKTGNPNSEVKVNGKKGTYYVAKYDQDGKLSDIVFTDPKNSNASSVSVRDMKIKNFCTILEHSENNNSVKMTYYNSDKSINTCYIYKRNSVVRTAYEYNDNGCLIAHIVRPLKDNYTIQAVSYIPGTDKPKIVTYGGDLDKPHKAKRIELHNGEIIPEKVVYVKDGKLVTEFV